MNMKEQEKELMEKIDKLGLIRYVKHEYMNKPKKISIIDHETGKASKSIVIGITKIWFYDKSVYGNVSKDERENGKYNVAEGVAYCSFREPHFSRQVGRLVATGRALKEYTQVKTKDMRYISLK